MLLKLVKMIDLLDVVQNFVFIKIDQIIMIKCFVNIIILIIVSLIKTLFFVFFIVEQFEIKIFSHKN